MRHRSMPMAVVLTLALGGIAVMNGCTGVNSGTSALSGGEIAGGGVGAVAGGTAAAVAGADPTGVVGGLIAGLATGAMAGGFLSGEPGPPSDTFGAIDSLDAGESRLWRDPDDSTRIITTSVDSVFRAPDGSLCKRYTEKQPAEHGVLTTSGMACKEPGGGWQPASA